MSKGQETRKRRVTNKRIKILTSEKREINSMIVGKEKENENENSIV